VAEDLAVFRGARHGEAPIGCAVARLRRR